jgi:hypothetical protein
MSLLEKLTGKIENNAQQMILVELTKQNATLKQLLHNSNAIYKLNRLTPGFITLTFTVTATSQLIYIADKDRVITMAHPSVAGEAAGLLYFGSDGVTTTSGYPLIAGDIYSYFIEKHTSIWAVSDTSAVLHLIIN